MPKLTIAIAGCAHGEMDKIYATLKSVEEAEGKKAELLLCCGDFQSVRNYGDLKAMHVPPKYAQLMTFHRYYSGEVRAPLLTLFVGGNHEASNYLAELPQGGWVAPNIYFMGLASVLNYKGLRIAGLSGIGGKRAQVFRLRQLVVSTSRRPVDVFLSHDWPAGITAPEYGDPDWLVRKKPHFEEEVAVGKLGNPYTFKLLTQLKPRYWFSAHLHVKYPALVPHESGETRFLALDKCLPHRGFLQLLDIEIPEERSTDNWLSYDLDWLAVLRSTDELVNSSRSVSYMPGPGMGAGLRYDFTPTVEEQRAVNGLFPDSDFTVPSNFAITAPAHRQNDLKGDVVESYSINPQSTHFCDLLGIQNLNRILYERNSHRLPATAKEENLPSSAPLPSFPQEEAREVDDLFDVFKTESTASTSTLPPLAAAKLRFSPTPEEIEKPSYLKDFEPPPIKRHAETPIDSSDPEKGDDEETPIPGGAMAKLKRRNLASCPDEDD